MSIRALPSLLIVLLLAGCGADTAVVPRAQSGEHSAHGPVAPSQSSMLALEAARPIPYRNLYALANELKLRPPRSIAHVVRSVSPNYPVGHHDTFDVLGEDQNRFFHLHATIGAETPHLYLYVQDGLKVPVSALRRAAQTFEHSIYPTDRSFFGSEWRPGVDGDPHITCLIGDLHSSGAAGFYSAEDEYPHDVYRYSNEREMIYINGANTIPGDGSFNQTLAHEFQHMIHWHMHPHDNAWLNEGMSMLAELVNHYPPSGEPDAFDSLPTTQLDSWSLSGDSSFAHYGAAYLFLTYLYDRFGRSVIKDIVADKKYTDLAVIDDVLRRHHIAESADQVFADWVATNVINDRAANHGLYSYRQLSYRVTNVRVATAPFTFAGRVPPYAAQYFKVNVPADQKPFRLSFSAPSTVPLVGVASSTPFWWSNRGDMSDTRLTRTVDLRHVRHATLHFQTWYDIEKDYDYAYVEVSTDGKEWQTLPGGHTTHSDPNGANYGYGYTGSSKKWLSETVNLSQYAGKRIQLRFQYITDDEYNGQGMVIRNIAIPEVGFHDSQSGWDAQGFLPVMQNALPAHWTVELIESTSHGTRVSTVPISAGGRGTVLVNPQRDGIQKVIVATFMAAPKTTVERNYTLKASAG